MIVMEVYNITVDISSILLIYYIQCYV